MTHPVDAGSRPAGSGIFIMRQSGANSKYDICYIATPYQGIDALSR